MTLGTLRVRLTLLGVLAIVVLITLVTRLWYLQVISAEEFEVQAVANTDRLLLEPAPRGRIFDRNGAVLVDNRESLVVTIDKLIYENDFDDAGREDLVLRLATEISQAGRLTKVFEIFEAMEDTRYGPLDAVPVADDVTEEFQIILAERSDEFPGVETITRTVRVYPYQSLAAHVLGYVGPITEAQLAQVAGGPNFYSPNDEIGQSGVEATFEHVLRGTPGFTRVEVDKFGDTVQVLERQSPVVGNDIQLTLDINLQALAERELADGLTLARQQVTEDPNEPQFTAPGGAMVILDPNGSEVLAMASYPTYDPREFVEGITQERFERLNDPAEDSPLYNRALGGLYPPGSTFKLVTAYAALNTGLIGPRGVLGVDTVYDDMGRYVVPDCDPATNLASCTFTNAQEEVHGEVDLQRAITVSSDVYFYYLGDTVDRSALYDRESIQQASRQFGFGSQSGIALPGEQAGNVPTPTQRAEDPEATPWLTGDTVVLAIGQGQFSSTPLQLANAYATFANGGTLYSPKIVSRTVNPISGDTLQEFSDRVLNEVYLPEEVRTPILRGLSGVPGEDGTAETAFFGFPLEDWPVAAKTGTSEVVGKADFALFAAFGPTPDPQYTVVALLEEAGFGGRTAAPVVRAVLEAIATDSVPTARTVDELAELASREPGESEGSAAPDGIFGDGSGGFAPAAVAVGEGAG